MNKRDEDYARRLIDGSTFIEPGRETRELINRLIDNHDSFAVFSCEYCGEVYIMKWNKEGGMFYNTLLTQDIMEAHYGKCKSEKAP